MPNFHVADESMGKYIVDDDPLNIFPLLVRAEKFQHIPNARARKGESLSVRRRRDSHEEIMTDRFDCFNECAVRSNKRHRGVTSSNHKGALIHKNRVIPSVL